MNGFMEKKIWRPKPVSYGIIFSRVFYSVKSKKELRSITEVVNIIYRPPGLSFLLESVGLPILKDTFLDLLRP
jgi:hypothetical protein